VDVLEDGFSYPVRGEWSGRLIIGGLLVLSSVSLVPLLLVFGYLFRGGQRTMADEDTPPAWDRWGKLLVDGLRASVVTFLYVFVPSLVVGLVTFVLTVVLTNDAETRFEAGQALAGVGLLGVLLGVVVGLFVAYTLPAALATFAAEDSVWAAFSVGQVVSFAFSIEYLTALVQMLFVLAFASVTSATVFLAPVGLFWSALTASRIFGTAYRERLGVPP
jgi:hypothetical protein